jgi:hypothetical protein
MMWHVAGEHLLSTLDNPDARVVLTNGLNRLMSCETGSLAMDRAGRRRFSSAVQQFVIDSRSVLLKR